MEVAPNLRVLAAPDTPEGAMDVTPAAVERILSAARERFDEWEARDNATGGWGDGLELHLMLRVGA